MSISQKVALKIDNNIYESNQNKLAETSYITIN